MSHLVVSPCTANDVAAVEALWPRRGCDARYERQQAGNSTFLLARLEGGVVGRAEVMWTGPRMPAVAVVFADSPEINGLDVVAHARRRGVGTSLVLAAEDMARARGLTSIGLGVGVDNLVAQRLYRDLGYDGDFSYADTYVWRDEGGAEHEAADACTFLVKSLGAARRILDS